MEDGFIFKTPRGGWRHSHAHGNPSTDIYYYSTNHLGSTAFVTDNNATVTQGFLYAPFGEITTEYNANFGNNVLPKYSFNAKELDEETGMYYYEARYYKPPVFTSRDAMFEKYFWMTPYAYCANNPMKFVDPTGMDWYQDAEGNAVFNKDVNENTKLGEGERYIGKTANWFGQTESDMQYLYQGDENGNVTCRDMTVNVSSENECGINVWSAAMSGFSAGAGILEGSAANSKSTFRMTNSKGTFDFHYYKNGWKGNQYVKPNSVSSIGKAVKRVGNMAGLYSMYMDFSQMRQASTIEDKVEHGLDVAVDALGFTRVGLPVALCWNLGGKQLHRMYVNKVLKPQIQMGINPGLIQYQPSK